MAHRRHSDENRADQGLSSLQTWRDLEWFRRRATRRKLILLECAIVRHAPFADCGRPLWDLMADQPWFRQLMLPAEWYRLRDLMMPAEWSRRVRGLPLSTSVEPTGRSWPNTWVSGHDAIEWLEDHADGGDEDRLVVAQEHFRDVEYAAEADFHQTPPEPGDDLEISYAAADWLRELREFDETWANVLDYYLESFPGTFPRWASSRSIHPEHRPVAIGLIDDLFGHPSHDIQFARSWRTPEVVALAARMDDARDFAAAPALADLLEAAGCDNRDVLAHGRADRLHARGCWVVDRILRRR